MGINKELLQLTLDMIKSNLEHWDQTKWHCGTTHCFAGGIVKNLLGLTPYQANILFASYNTLEDLEHHVNVLVNTDLPLFSMVCSTINK